MPTSNIRARPISISAIFTEFDYADVTCTYLTQLEDTGILNIYIILTDEESQYAQNKKIQRFDDNTPSKTILEYYQSHRPNSQLKFHILNVGQATNEEEKLKYYLENVQETYLINLFIYPKSPLVSQALHSGIIKDEITEYSFLYFFKMTSTSKELPPFEPEHYSDDAIHLFQREVNPCICFQKGIFDIQNYFWLFEVFGELIAWKITQSDNELTQTAKEKLKQLTESYRKNIIDLEKVEKVFETTHKELYFFNTTEFRLQMEHRQNIENKENLQQQFPQIIVEMIELYQTLAFQKDKQASNTPTKKN